MGAPARCAVVIGRSLVVLVLGLCACAPEPSSTTSPAPAVAPAIETTVIADDQPASQNGRIDVDAVLEMTPTAQELEGTVDHCAQGRLDAERDLAAGLFAIETYGYAPACQAAVAHELWSRYQVNVHMLGCVINKRITEHTACYNAVMRAAIEAKHGAKIWKRARRLAGCERLTEG